MTAAGESLSNLAGQLHSPLNKLPGQPGPLLPVCEQSQCLAATALPAACLRARTRRSLLRSKVGGAGWWLGCPSTGLQHPLCARPAQDTKHTQTHKHAHAPSKSNGAVNLAAKSYCVHASSWMMSAYATNDVGCTAGYAATNDTSYTLHQQYIVLLMLMLCCIYSGHQAITPSHHAGPVDTPKRHGHRHSCMWRLPTTECFAMHPITHCMLAANRMQGVGVAVHT